MNWTYLYYVIFNIKIPFSNNIGCNLLFEVVVGVSEEKVPISVFLVNVKVNSHITILRLINSLISVSNFDQQSKEGEKQFGRSPDESGEGVRIH